MSEKYLKKIKYYLISIVVIFEFMYKTVNFTYFGAQSLSSVVQQDV